MVNTPDPYQYLENKSDELDDQNLQALKDFADAYTFSEGTLYSHLTRLYRFLTFAPDDFDLSNPTEEGISEAISNIEDDDEYDARTSLLKGLNKFLTTYKGGEYEGLTDEYRTQKSDGGAKVERWMILTEDEVQELVSNCNSIRDKLYIRLMYETGATPGELLEKDDELDKEYAKVKDVDPQEETIFIRGNKDHRSQTMELHATGLQYMREYLEMHPAVDNIYNTTSDAPLFVKKRAFSCKNCGHPKEPHTNEDHDDYEDTCQEYDPKKVEPARYRGMRKVFKNALERSSIDRDIKQKFMRKSILSRLASELKYEQLCNFARWVPGSSQAQHYIQLDNKELRDEIAGIFKDKPDQSEKQVITCKNCNSRNDPDNLSCKFCNRPLNVAKSEKMKEAERLANQLADMEDGDMERFLKAAQMKNGEGAIEDMVEEIVEEKISKSS